MIRFSCDNCGRGFELPDKAAGMVGTCVDCGTRVRVPGGEPLEEQLSDDLAALAAAASAARSSPPIQRELGRPSEPSSDANEETVADDEPTNDAPPPAPASPRPRIPYGSWPAAARARGEGVSTRDESNVPVADPAGRVAQAEPQAADAPPRRLSAPAAAAPRRSPVAERAGMGDRSRPSPLAIVSLGVGLIALGTAWWPLIGMTVSMVGLTLGTAAVILFSVRREPWIGLPIAGLGLSLAAFIIGGVIMMSLAMSLLGAGEGVFGGAGGAGSNDLTPEQQEMIGQLEAWYGAGAGRGLIEEPQATGDEAEPPPSAAARARPRQAERPTDRQARPRMTESAAEWSGGGAGAERRESGGDAQRPEPEGETAPAGVAHGPAYVRVVSVRGRGPAADSGPGRAGRDGALAVEVELVNRSEGHTITHRPWAAGGASEGSGVTLTDGDGRTYRLLNQPAQEGQRAQVPPEAAVPQPRRAGPQVPEGLRDLEGVDELLEGYGELFEMLGELQGLAEGGGVGGVDPQVLEMARRAMGEAPGDSGGGAGGRLLSPGRSLRETLVFGAPARAPDADELWLDLPAEHFGGAGMIRLRIPSETIDGL